MWEYHLVFFSFFFYQCLYLIWRLKQIIVILLKFQSLKPPCSMLLTVAMLDDIVVSSKRANVLWNVCIQLGALSKWIVTLVTFEMSRPSRMLLTVALSEDKVVLLEQPWLLHFPAHGVGANALSRLYLLCKIVNRTKPLNNLPTIKSLIKWAALWKTCLSMTQCHRI